MADAEQRRKCYKCGCSFAQDNVKLFRFPKPSKRNLVRCENWAQYIFPDGEHWSIALQTKLHNDHRMLCQKHFRDEDFTDPSKKKLLRIAVPSDEVPVPAQTRLIICPITGLSNNLGITNFKPVAKQVPVLVPPTHQVIDPVPGLSRNLDATKVKPVAKEVPVSAQPRVILGPIPGPSNNLDITNFKPVAKQVPVLVPPTYQVIDPVPGLSRNLNSTNVKPVAKSSPYTGDQDKFKSLYKKCTLYMKRIRKLKNTIKTKNNMQKLNELHKNISFQKLMELLTSTSTTPLLSQSSNKTKSRQWTMDDEIIALLLRLNKRSPTGKRLLRMLKELGEELNLQTQTINNLSATIDEKLKPLMEENVTLKNQVETLQNKVYTLEKETRTNIIVLHKIPEVEKSVSNSI